MHVLNETFYRFEVPYRPKICSGTRFWGPFLCPGPLDPSFSAILTWGWPKIHKFSQTISSFSLKTNFTGCCTDKTERQNLGRKTTLTNGCLYSPVPLLSWSFLYNSNWCHWQHRDPKAQWAHYRVKRFCLCCKQLWRVDKRSVGSRYSDWRSRLSLLCANFLTHSLQPLLDCHSTLASLQTRSTKAWSQDLVSWKRTTFVVTASVKCYWTTL